MSEKTPLKGILKKKSGKSTRQNHSVRNQYHSVPNEPLPSVAFNPETMIRTVPRLKFGNPFLLNPRNNYINAKSGTRVQNIRRGNPGKKYSRAMIGFNHPINEASTISTLNHQRSGSLKTYNGRRRRSSSASAASAASADMIEAELQPRYGTRENRSFYNNGTFQRTNILPEEILHFRNSNSVTSENFNRMPMQRMSVGNQPPIRLMNRFRKLVGLNENNQRERKKKEKGKKYGGSKKNSGSKKISKNKSSSTPTHSFEAEINELLNGLYGEEESTISSSTGNNFNSWYGFNLSKPAIVYNPYSSYSSSQSHLPTPSIGYDPSSFFHSSSESHLPRRSSQYDPELYGNNDPSSSLHVSQSAVAAPSIPVPIHPYNRRPHGLNQRAWFEMPEKETNSRKKSVTIAAKSKKRIVPKYRSSRMHKMPGNNASGHEINGYEFENNLNNQGNPINTSSHYNENSNVNTQN
jgi:hypothetical protein